MRADANAAEKGASGGGRRLLGQVLKGQGVVKESQVQEALAEQRKHGGLIGQCLVQLGHATTAQIARGLAEQAGLEAVDVTRATPDKAALALVDASTAHAYGVLPLRVEGRTLVVACFSVNCPLSKKFAPELARLEKELTATGAALLFYVQMG